jgi:iron(III) transport system permease protein
MSAVAQRGPLPRRLPLLTEALVARGGVVLLATALLVFLTVPLGSLLVRSLESRSGEFVGLVNFAAYFSSPALPTRRATRSPSPP